MPPPPPPPSHDPHSPQRLGEEHVARPHGLPKPQLQRKRPDVPPPTADMPPPATYMTIMYGGHYIPALFDCCRGTPKKTVAGWC